MIKIDHIGMGVANLDTAVNFYLSQGFTEVVRFEKVSPGIRAVVVEKDGSKLELFDFLDTSDPQVRYMESHIGYLVSDFEKDLADCLAAGYKIVIPETKGTSVKRFLFLADSNGNYIELLER